MPEHGHFFKWLYFRRRAVNVNGLCGEFTKMEEWKKFYSSVQWKEARESYTKYRRGLCEICLSKGIIKAGKFFFEIPYIFLGKEVVQNLLGSGCSIDRNTGFFR